MWSHPDPKTETCTPNKPFSRVNILVEKHIYSPTPHHIRKSPYFLPKFSAKIFHNELTDSFWQTVIKAYHYCLIFRLWFPSPWFKKNLHSCRMHQNEWFSLVCRWIHSPWLKKILILRGLECTRMNDFYWLVNEYIHHGWRKFWFSEL